MKSLIVTLISLFSLLGLAACETFEGFGRDVQKVGEEIEGEAEREQRE